MKTYRRTAFCDNCGKPYPWTERTQESANELIEFSQLNEADKQDLKSSLINLVENGPKTSLAIVKYKTYAQKAGTEIAKGLKEVLVDVVSETVKKAIWG